MIKGLPENNRDLSFHGIREQKTIGQESERYDWNIRHRGGKNSSHVMGGQ